MTTTRLERRFESSVDCAISPAKGAISGLQTRHTETSYLIPDYEIVRLRGEHEGEIGVLGYLLHL